MEPEGSLPHSNMPATCPYPEPARSSPDPKLMSLFRFLDRTKLSVQVRGKRSCFLTKPVFTVRIFQHLAQPQARGPPLVGCPRLFNQYISSYPPYWRPFLLPQPEDAPWDPLIKGNLSLGRHKGSNPRSTGFALRFGK
jgi:hypothetical protein